MFATIIATGVVTLAFKLGMKAQSMKAEGKSVPEIAARMPVEACRTMVCVTKWCYENIRGKK